MIMCPTTVLNFFEIYFVFSLTVLSSGLLIILFSGLVGEWTVGGGDKANREILPCPNQTKPGRERRLAEERRREEQVAEEAAAREEGSPERGHAPFTSHSLN